MSNLAECGEILKAWDVSPKFTSMETPGLFLLNRALTDDENESAIGLSGLGTTGSSGGSMGHLLTSTSSGSGSLYTLTSYVSGVSSDAAISE